MKETTKTIYANIFPRKKPIIGVVRLLPLLGYPEFPGIRKVVEVALNDIKKLEKAGFDGALVDNDAHPHVVKATVEMAACFAVVMKELVQKSKIPLGTQFLIDDPEASLAIAKVSGSSFIRTDFFVDKVRTKYGIFNPNASKIMKYKKKVFGRHILVFADIQVKHAKMLSKKSIQKSTRQALRVGADAVIVTGSWTGQAPDVRKLGKVKKASANKPVLIGSGLMPENTKKLLSVADGALIGTAIRDGSRIDFPKAKKLIKQVKKIKGEEDGK